MKTITLHRDDFRDDKKRVIKTWEGLLHMAGVKREEYDKFCSVEISGGDLEVVAYLKEGEEIK